MIQIAPLLLITGPEKRCGKSLLLNLISKLSYQAMSVSNISPPAVFRVIDAWQPTLFIDEVDTLLKDNNELKGIINAGYTRSACNVMRIEGDDREIKIFSVWSAKALSGIDWQQDDTITDRSVTLRMRRKLPHEKADKFRHKYHVLFEPLAAKLARFKEDYIDQIAKADPGVPDILNDRAQDNWESMIAIADIVGGTWPARAREAAIFLSQTASATITNGVGIELLGDLRELFASKYADKMSLQDIVDGLCLEPEKRWATYYKGKPVNPRQIANHLHKFEIPPRPIRMGGEVIAKGYLLSDFDDAFRRYLNAPQQPVEV